MKFKYLERERVFLLFQYHRLALNPGFRASFFHVKTTDGGLSLSLGTFSYLDH